MKKIRAWGISATLLALTLSAVEERAIATAVSSPSSANLVLESKPTQAQQQDKFQLAQGLAGQCRAASRSIFVYRDRSTSSPTVALEPNEPVTLAEADGRSGWIAISSPTRGFVEARDLKRCLAEQNPVVTTPPRSNLCRQVAYGGLEGVAVRERPRIDSRSLGAVFLGQQVALDNSLEPTTDSTGREWVKITAPVFGWMSNGFPATGDINLLACF